MYKLYIDEKGPQNSFRKKEVFTMSEKIKYGSDKMHSYVANALLIPVDNLEKVESEFLALERDYLTKRTQLKVNELKGQNILKSNFVYGVSSLKEREVTFYNSVFSILENNGVNNLFFSINKIAIITNGQLGDWILELENRRFITNPAIVQYILTKYAEIESSEEVIDKLLDETVSTKDLLHTIKKDLQKIIECNKNNLRMKRQVDVYKEIVKLIKKYNHLESNPVNIYQFDWSKFTYALDLWITEKEYLGKLKFSDIEVLLDEGMKKHHLDRLKFSRVEESCKSEDHVGLRLTDHLVVLLGNYMYRLRDDSSYNYENPEKIKIISNKWFELNEAQFLLIKRIYIFFLGDDSLYSFVNDTYFDESLNIESFLRYVDSYKNYNEFTQAKVNHPTEHFKIYQNLADYKWEQSNKNAVLVRNKYGSYKKAIESGDMRPL
ncbi:MAG: hypothetical protein ABS865_00505 [Desemzia incerta]